MKTKTTTAALHARHRARAEPFVLRLYVAGQPPKSNAAFASPRRFARNISPGNTRWMSVTFLATRTWRAATGSLSQLTEPVRKVIGDLANTERVLMGFDPMPWE